MRLVLLTVTLRLLRMAGLVLPLHLLWLLLWPAAMIRSIWQVGGHWPDLQQLQTSPLGLRIVPKSDLRIWKLWHRRAQLKLTDLIFLWADRKHCSLWHRDRCDALDRLALVESGTRPVILLSLHFGPSYILLNWLRSRGLPAAMVGGKGVKPLLAYRNFFAKKRDRTSGLADIPNLIEAGCVGEMYDHLASNRILIIDVDGAGGRHLAIPQVDECGLVMNTGPLKLAVMTGAIVLPCLTTSTSFFGFRIHLGEPIPQLRSADEHQQQMACEHVLREYLPVLKAAPEECSHTLLKRFVMSPGGSH